jgi:IclR family transcriptional regulator, acetate operon repressor
LTQPPRARTIVHIVKQRSTAARHTQPAGTQAIGRAFAILRAFTDAEREWTLTDLSRRVGLTKPTALRLLSALEREGMVQRRGPGGGYRLGSRAIVLGALAQRSTDLLTAARPELERLAHATGETASLEMLVGTEILVLEEVRGRLRGSWAEFVGARWPAHAAATGKVLLAAAREERSEAWEHFRQATRGRLPKYTRRTLTGMTRLSAELTRVQRRGFATAIEELEEGYVALGAPVRNPPGRTVAAVCLGGHASRFTRAKRVTLGRAVTETARRISAQLGADGGLSGRRT